MKDRHNNELANKLGNLVSRVSGLIEKNGISRTSNKLLKKLDLKKIEKHFAAKHPDKWIPAYSRVTFSDRPYVEALALGDQQEAIMQEIMKLPQIEERWDSREVENNMLRLLEGQ